MAAWLPGGCAKIRVLKTRILAEGWDTDFGGFAWQQARICQEISVANVPDALCVPGAEHVTGCLAERVARSFDFNAGG